MIAIDMPMPTDCERCPFMDENFVCRAGRAVTPTAGARSPDCPLRSVKTARAAKIHHNIPGSVRNCKAEIARSIAELMLAGGFIRFDEMSDALTVDDVISLPFATTIIGQAWVVEPKEE